MKHVGYFVSLVISAIFDTINLKYVCISWLIIAIIENMKWQRDISGLFPQNIILIAASLLPTPPPTPAQQYLVLLVCSLFTTDSLDYGIWLTTSAWKKPFFCCRPHKDIVLELFLVVQSNVWLPKELLRVELLSSKLVRTSDVQLTVSVTRSISRTPHPTYHIMWNWPASL